MIGLWMMRKILHSAWHNNFIYERVNKSERIIFEPRVYGVLLMAEFDDESDLTRPLHGCRPVFVLGERKDHKLLIVYHDAAIIVFDSERIAIRLRLPIMEDVKLFEEALIA